MKWLKRFGLAFLSFAIFSILAALLLPATHTWTPVRVPISLTPGTITSPEFKTDLDANYEINIEVDREIDFDKLDCLLGISFMPCSDVPSLIDMSWSVTSEGTTVATGSSADVNLGGWGPTIERTIGRFRARRGRKYVAHLNVNKDASELAVTNPRLEIGVHPSEYKGNMILAMLAATVGWGSILLSVFAFLIVGLVQVVKKRQAPPKTL
jgi:hypothetical protein